MATDRLLNCGDHLVIKLSPDLEVGGRRSVRCVTWAKSGTNGAGKDRVYPLCILAASVTSHPMASILR